MKNLSNIRRTAAAAILTAALAMAPALQAEAQTSRNLGRVLTKAYKNGRKKELPSLVPKKEQQLPTFSGPKVCRYSREQIINYHDDGTLIDAFTWTENFTRSTHHPAPARKLWIPH